MCLKIFLHPNPLLFTPEAITICHQTRSDSSFQGLSRTNHSNAFPPKACLDRMWGQLQEWQDQGPHMPLAHHTPPPLPVYMPKPLPPIIDKTTIQRFYKRLYYLVWQATEVNNKQPVACIGKVHMYLTLQATSKPPTKLIKMSSKRAGRLSPKT